jgi:multimeric flavodoxin WrbA
MSLNVLFISSSPRQGGNSDRIGDQFALGAQSRGHHVEKISLVGKTLHFCTACEHCQSSGGQCVFRDDVAPLLDKMVAADILLLSTPVYFYNMVGSMKTLIDRSFAKYTQVTNKKVFLVVTGADTNEKNLELTMRGLEAYVDLLPGSTVAGRILGHGLAVKTDEASLKFEKLAFQMGSSLSGG